MSSWYDLAGVFTLKRTASPTLTLISVAKPWMVELPAPLTSQVVDGVPGWMFSHATGVGAAQGSAAAAAGDTSPATSIAAGTISATRAELMRRAVSLRGCLAEPVLVTCPPRGGATSGVRGRHWLRVGTRRPLERAPAKAR